ncbi:MAG: GGDEF domain-containing protein [Actinomycetota bacterium]
MSAGDSDEARHDGEACSAAQLARAAGVALVIVGTDGTIHGWHGTGDRLLGLHGPTAPPATWPMLFDPERTEQLWTALNDPDGDSFRQQLRSLDGSRWIEISGTRMPEQPDRFACVVTDATDSVRESSSMRRIEHVLDGTSDFVVIWRPDDDRVTWSNDTATIILGLGPDLGRSIGDVVPPDQARNFELALEHVATSGNWAGTVDFEPAPGYRVPCKVNLIKGRDPETDDPSVSLVATEISDLRAAEDQLSWAAEHDQLTGLANRVRLNRHLETALRRVRATDELAGLLYCDLDRFKPINDQHGHAAGDAVLIAVSERMRSALRDHDLACRFGGDEFVLLINRISDAATLDRVAERIEQLVAQPVAFEGATVTVGVSIGAIVLDDRTPDVETALQRADQFMYAAKQTRIDLQLQGALGEQ